MAGNCLPDAFLTQIREIHTLPPELNGDCLRLMVAGFFLENLPTYRDPIKEELAESMSIGGWLRRLINPDIFLGGDFLYMLHDMTKVFF